jgi:hypothetical protein
MAAAPQASRRGPTERHFRPVRTAQPLPSRGPRFERAPEVHLHLHGVSAEDIAAIVAHHDALARHDAPS